MSCRAKFFRSWNEKFVEGLVEVERLAWSSPGKNIEACREKIRARVYSHHGGQTIVLAMIGNIPAGSQYAFRFNWDGSIDSLGSWDEHTAEGWTDRVHDPCGKTGFLVGVGVVPQFRGIRVRHNLRWPGMYRISELLIAATLDELLGSKGGPDKVIANARVPFYHKRPDLSIREYCALRRNDGKLFDPVLRFHERMGAKIIKPVAFSMEDSESLDAGCWVMYTHTFQGI
jgi:hypothetical protein